MNYRFVNVSRRQLGHLADGLLLIFLPAATKTEREGYISRFSLSYHSDIGQTVGYEAARAGIERITL